jgi:hypothetical protein
LCRQRAAISRAVAVAAAAAAVIAVIVVIQMYDSGYIC